MEYEQLIEIESFLGAFLAKTSRTEALLRLYNASWMINLQDGGMPLLNVATRGY